MLLAIWFDAEDLLLLEHVDTFDALNQLSHIKPFIKHLGIKLTLE